MEKEQTSQALINEEALGYSLNISETKRKKNGDLESELRNSLVNDYKML